MQNLQYVNMYGSSNVDSSVAAGGNNAYVNMDGSSNYGSVVGNLQQMPYGDFGACAPGMLCNLQSVTMNGSSNVDSAVGAGPNAYVNMANSSNFGSTVGNL